MGNIDLFHSRRSNYNRCEYWIRDERTATGTPSQWILNNKSDGIFYAKPISSRNNRMNIVNGMWALDSNSVTIETDDHLDNISRGCLVKYNDELWLVVEVQKEVHHKESEFSKKNDYKYIISITRG